MKVLHVVPSLGLRHGGVSVSVRELCQGLAALGLEVSVWTTDRVYDAVVDGPADERLRAAGVAVRYFPVHPWAWLGQRYAYAPALSEALRAQVPRVDVVHIHAVWLYPTRIAARVCQRARVPYVLSPCGALDPYSLRVHRFAKWVYGMCVERRTLAGAARLHFTSSLEQRQAWTFGVRRPSIVIPRSVSAEVASAVPLGTFRRRFPILDARRLVLFLGRLHPKKRLDLATEAFIAVATRFPDVQFVVAGPDDGAEASARGRLARAGLLARATFTGSLAAEDKWAALRDSTVLLLPSEEENFGVVVLEAMASGVPVLVSPDVGLAAAVAKAQAGLVVDRQPVAWAEALERLLEDPATCRAMGEAGRRVAQDEFGGAQVAAAMRETYAMVLQESRRARG